MPSPSPEALRVASLYELGVPERIPRGPAGERLGRGTGSSLEFQDRRPYVVGDDLRHLDWSAYARTDQHLVRLYREEIQPRLEILLDGSASMATAPAKAALAVDLCAVLATAGRRSGMPVRVVLLGDRPEEIAFERLESDFAAFDGRLPLAPALELAAPLLRPGALRFLLSDLLSPADVPALVRGLAARTGRLAVLQLLSPEDASPPRGAAFKLTDAETSETLDLVLDDRTVDRYQTRLRRLTDSYHAECRRAGGDLLTLTAADPIETLCRDHLVPAQVLVPK